jgi:hypothetical protein
MSRPIFPLSSFIKHISSSTRLLLLHAEPAFFPYTSRRCSKLLKKTFRGASSPKDGSKDKSLTKACTSSTSSSAKTPPLTSQSLEDMKTALPKSRSKTSGTAFQLQVEVATSQISSTLSSPGHPLRAPCSQFEVVYAEQQVDHEPRVVCNKLLFRCQYWIQLEPGGLRETVGNRRKFRGF